MHVIFVAQGAVIRSEVDVRHSSDGVENLLFLLFVLHKHQGFIMIQDIKPGSQSTSPSLIILGQSIVYAEVVAKQTGPNRRNNRFSAPSDECLCY